MASRNDFNKKPLAAGVARTSSTTSNLSALLSPSKSGAKGPYQSPERRIKPLMNSSSANNVASASIAETSHSEPQPSDKKNKTSLVLNEMTDARRMEENIRILNENQSITLRIGVNARRRKDLIEEYLKLLDQERLFLNQINPENVHFSCDFDVAKELIENRELYQEMKKALPALEARDNLFSTQREELIKKELDYRESLAEVSKVNERLKSKPSFISSFIQPVPGKENSLGNTAQLQSTSQSEIKLGEETKNVSTSGSLFIVPQPQPRPTECVAVDDTNNEQPRTQRFARPKSVAASVAQTGTNGLSPHDTYKKVYKNIFHPDAFNLLEDLTNQIKTNKDDRSLLLFYNYITFLFEKDEKKLRDLTAGDFITYLADSIKEDHTSIKGHDSTDKLITTQATKPWKDYKGYMYKNLDKGVFFEQMPNFAKWLLSNQKNVGAEITKFENLTSVPFARDVASKTGMGLKR